ncbi:MAG: T9SS type A sorting domain-containing protein, partial [Bacteroidota bacterium]
TGTAALDLANTYDKASLFFNFGADGMAVGADSVFLWDDVAFVSAPPLDQIDLPVTFEDPNTDYSLTDFGGNSSFLTTDPNDATNTVAQSTKTLGAQLWAGTTMGPMSGTGFANAIPFTATETKMTVRVWAPAAGIPIRLKAEDATDPTISVETEDTTIVGGTWEWLEFDFSNEVMGTAALDLNNTYDKASIFFFFGTDGMMAGADTIYLWDEVQFGGIPGPSLNQIDMPVTFEDSTVDYSVTDFGGNATMLTTDPEDAMNTVARTHKTMGAETWAGTTMGHPSGTGFANSMAFSATETRVNVRVYAPAAGIPVRLKVEDATNGNISVETEDTTTVANAWEVLEFDFNNEVAGTASLDLANTYDKASIFFHFGTSGMNAGADTTYYWDDVQFGPAVSAQTIEDLGVRVYPNPVASSLQLEADQIIDEYVIFNQIGQQMSRQRLAAPNTRIDMSQFMPGMYFLRLKIGSQSTTVKVIKQ